MATEMLLGPKDYEGEKGSAAVGRLVLNRGPFELETRDKETQGKAQTPRKGSRGNEKNSSDTNNLKSEHHFLGGDSTDDILFVKAWGQAAIELCKLLKIGEIYSISGGVIIGKTPN